MDVSEITAAPIGVVDFVVTDNWILRTCVFACCESCLNFIVNYQ